MTRHLLYTTVLLFVYCWVGNVGGAQNVHAQSNAMLNPLAPRGAGAEVGVSCALGTHQNRIGLLARWYWHWDNIQVNVHLAGFYHACALGNQAQGWEGQLRVGVVGAFGLPLPEYQNQFLSEVGHQTGRPFSLGYSLNVYWDNVHTSQITGSLGATGGNIGFVFENDFLAFQSQDRFRTGAISLFYQRDDFRFALQHIAWTADPYGDGTDTDHNHPTYNRRRARHGYRRLGNQRYHQCSAGILAVRALYHGPFNQTLGAGLGIDAEQIRHAIQNQFIHNTIDNPHIPMIDANGMPYLFGEDQTVRPVRGYGQLLLNPTGLY